MLDQVGNQNVGFLTTRLNYAGHDILPTSSLFLSSIERFLKAVAAAPTTRSTSYVNRSTRLGKPFSFLTKALVSTAN